MSVSEEAIEPSPERRAELERILNLNLGSRRYFRYPLKLYTTPGKIEKLLERSEIEW